MCQFDIVFLNENCIFLKIRATRSDVPRMHGAAKPQKLLTEAGTVKICLRSSLKRILFGKRLVWLSHSSRGILTHSRVGMCQFYVILVTGLNMSLLLQNSSQCFSNFSFHYHVVYII